MYIVKSFLVFIFLFFALQTTVRAQEGTDIGFGLTYVDIQLAYYLSNNSEEQDDLVWGESTIQWSFGGSLGDIGIGGFIYGCADKNFQCAYFGLTREFDLFDYFEVGLGAGRAWYDDTEWFVINPWVYFEAGRFTFTGFLEYIPSEVNAYRTFYRATAEWSINNRWGVELIHCERWNGCGPGIVYKFNDSWDLRFSWMELFQKSDEYIQGRLVLTYYWEP